MKKNIGILTAMACLMAGQLFATESESTWITSVPDATAQAKKEHKLILLDFTGSDWCGWCKKLEAETFSKPDFAAYAKKNLVLVTLDFPARKPQSDDLKAANKDLQEKYDVHGYPTIVLLTPEGKVLFKQVGYLEGGPPTMIAKIEDAKKTAT